MKTELLVSHASVSTTERADTASLFYQAGESVVQIPPMAMATRRSTAQGRYYSNQSIHLAMWTDQKLEDDIFQLFIVLLCYQDAQTTLHSVFGIPEFLVRSNICGTLRVATSFDLDQRADVRDRLCTSWSRVKAAYKEIRGRSMVV